MNDAPTPTVAAMNDPWIELSRLIGLADPQGLQSFLDQLPPWEQARAVSRLDEQAKMQLLSVLPAERAAELMEIVTVTHAVDLIDRIEPQQAAKIVGEMRSDLAANVLHELPEKQTEAILDLLDPREAAAARRLAEYPRETAGGVMITEFLAFYHHLTVGDVLQDLRAHAEDYARYSVQYAYVVNTKGQLIGVLGIRDVLFARHDREISELMIPNPHSVRDDMPLEELDQFFETLAFVGVPVVDAEGGLVGVVLRSGVEKALENRAQNMFLKISGIIGGEEFRTMSTLSRSGRRLSWLSINIVLNIFAAGVIAAYTDTLEAVIALAVFLPIISDMSGCSGNQAVAISMRELTLGLVRPRELFRVIGKEASVGIINGIVLGILLGAIAWVWKGSPWLGLVVGAALALNTIVAVVIGGSLPLILKRLKLDPAMVSGPILTTCTDMCGFFFVLSFAQAILPRLL